MSDWLHHLTGLTVGLTAILFGTLVYQVLKYWSFFSDRGIPFVRGMPLLGSNYKVFFGSVPVATAMRRLYERFPDEPIIGTYEIGGFPNYMIRDPELIKQVAVKLSENFMNRRTTVDAGKDPLVGKSLVFARGNEWRELRRTVNPSYTASKLRGMSGLIIKCANQFVDTLIIADDAKRGGDAMEYEMKDTYSRFAADTIGSCAFGIEVNSMADRDNDFFRMGSSVIMATLQFTAKFIGYSSIPKLMSFLGIKLLLRENEHYFRELVRLTLKHRQTNKVQRNDMIDLLLQARAGTLTDDEIVTGTTAPPTSAANKNIEITDTVIAAQCMIFFLAGYDTTSSLMSFMSHELAIHPDIQDRLIAEIDAVRQSLNGKPITYEDLLNMPYMEMIISEALRKWIPVATYDRICNAATTLDIGGGKQLHVGVGEGMVIAAYGLHNDPKYWSKPEEFDPERFNEVNAKHIVSGTYLPFGLGPRICPARRFALLETKALYFHLLSKFRLEPCARTENPLRLGVGIIGITPKNGIWLKLKRR